MPAMKGHYEQYDSTSYVASSDAKLGHGNQGGMEKKMSGKAYGKMGGSSSRKSKGMSDKGMSYSY